MLQVGDRSQPHGSSRRRVEAEERPRGDLGASQVVERAGARGEASGVTALRELLLPAAFQAQQEQRAPAFAPRVQQLLSLPGLLRRDGTAVRDALGLAARGRDAKVVGASRAREPIVDEAAVPRPHRRPQTHGTARQPSIGAAFDADHPDVRGGGTVRRLLANVDDVLPIRRPVRRSRARRRALAVVGDVRELHRVRAVDVGEPDLLVRRPGAPRLERDAPPVGRDARPVVDRRRRDHGLRSAGLGEAVEVDVRAVVDEEQAVARLRAGGSVGTGRNRLDPLLRRAAVRTHAPQAGTHSSPLERHAAARIDDGASVSRPGEAVDGASLTRDRARGARLGEAPRRARARRRGRPA